MIGSVQAMHHSSLVATTTGGLVDFSGAISDLLVALAAAAIIAGVALLISFARNLRLERGVSAAIGMNGASTEYSVSPPICRFTVQVSNRTGAYIRIRSIVLIGSHPFQTMHFKPRTEWRITQNPLDNEMMLDEFPRSYAARGILAENEIPGTQLLPPKTLGFWEAPSNQIGVRELDFKKGYIAFEYGTIFGGTALVRTPISDSGFRLIKSSLEELSNAKREGRLLTLPNGATLQPRPTT